MVAVVCGEAHTLCTTQEAHYTIRKLAASNPLEYNTIYKHISRILKEEEINQITKSEHIKKLQKQAEKRKRERHRPQIKKTKLQLAREIYNKKYLKFLEKRHFISTKRTQRLKKKKKKKGVDAHVKLYAPEETLHITLNSAFIKKDENTKEKEPTTTPSMKIQTPERRPATTEGGAQWKKNKKEINVDTQRPHTANTLDKTKTSEEVNEQHQEEDYHVPRIVAYHYHHSPKSPKRALSAHHSRRRRQHQHQKRPSTASNVIPRRRQVRKVPKKPRPLSRKAKARLRTQALFLRTFLKEESTFNEMKMARNIMKVQERDQDFLQYRNAILSNNSVENDAFDSCENRASDLRRSIRRDYERRRAERSLWSEGVNQDVIVNSKAFQSSTSGGFHQHLRRPPSAPNTIRNVSRNRKRTTRFRYGFDAEKKWKDVHNII